jgi:small subunit ribosomal protein S8
MSLSDPISDMLLRVRNALGAGLEVVEMPHSVIKGEIARILKKEGFVSDYVVEGGIKRSLRIYLKYGQGREAVIKGLKRESRPGLRKYVTVEQIPQDPGGMGVVVVSTSDGLMTGHEARKRGVGGELICSIW